MTGAFSSLCLDLFLLGHAHLEAGEAGDGRAFERRVRDHLQGLSMPHAAGFRVFGRQSLSGLYHQLDEQTNCGPVHVVGEWKAYRGLIPKNDLMRFKGATDDYWMATRASERAPIMRVFGGTGQVTPRMRTYAAHAGIALVTPDRWPVAALCDPHLLWGPAELEPPSPVDVRSMLSLVRPLDQVLRPEEDGGWRVPRAALAEDIAYRADVWLRHSERAWAWWDDLSPSRFEALVGARCRLDRYAA
jgi:hypothetical protein